MFSGMSSLSVSTHSRRGQKRVEGGGGRSADASTGPSELNALYSASLYQPLYGAAMDGTDWAKVGESGSGQRDTRIATWEKPSSAETSSPGGGHAHFGTSHTDKLFPTKSTTVTRRYEDARRGSLPPEDAGQIVHGEVPESRSDAVDAKGRTPTAMYLSRDFRLPFRPTHTNVESRVDPDPPRLLSSTTSRLVQLFQFKASRDVFRSVRNRLSWSEGV
ncbi:unnamed protein product [Caenorhabditis auriculariae]|uniref:Uncharacterized protein n=1 Tax=Caenorhabditis auriculariae TaxID=2777116 RepID=A0A8S1GZP0_9PELO|nr:unnamed protein product [Caenorhabditis auriculariae]